MTELRTETSTGMSSSLLDELADLELDKLDLGNGPYDPGPALTADELLLLQNFENMLEAKAEVDYLIEHGLDGEVSKPSAAVVGKTIQEEMAAWLENLRSPKPKTGRAWQPSPKQIEVARYRKEEGRDSWNFLQKVMRWQRAEEQGRDVIPRQNLTKMTPEDKAIYKRDQDRERQRRRRAAKKAAHLST